MGYPSENVESIWRNPLEEVQRLLEEKHKVRRNLFSSVCKISVQNHVFSFDRHSIVDNVGRSVGNAVKTTSP